MKMQLCSSSSSLSRSSAPDADTANALAAIRVDRNLALVAPLLAPAPVDEIAQIGLELRHGCNAAGKLLGAQHRLERAEDRQRPAEQRAALVRRNAEHVADELHGNRGGEILDQVDRAAVGAARQRTVDQPIDQRLDARLQRREHARRESRRQQLAHAAVIGRIVEHQAGGVVLVEQAVGEVGSKVVSLVRAPGFGVAIDRGAVVVAAEEIRPVRHAMDRIVLAQCAVERERIGQERGIEPLEIEGERGLSIHRDVGCARHAALSPCGSARPNSARGSRSAPG